MTSADINDKYTEASEGMWDWFRAIDSMLQVKDEFLRNRVHKILEDAQRLQADIASLAEIRVGV